MNEITTPKSSSKFVAEEYQDEEGHWRVKIKSQRGKLDDEAKERFLEEYRKNGRMMDSAHCAGVTNTTIRRHIADDSDFAEACLEAESTYVDRLIAHHQDLVFNGTKKVMYDRNGNIMSEETVFPVRLIELELKKHDEGYREKRDVNMNVSGGVLVAPAEMKTIEDWEKKFGEGNTIEGEVAEVPDPDVKKLNNDDSQSESP